MQQYNTTPLDERAQEHLVSRLCGRVASATILLKKLQTQEISEDYTDIETTIARAEAQGELDALQRVLDLIKELSLVWGQK